MKRHIFSIKTILHSMIATFLVLTLMMGFIIVEKNTRKIGFADTHPWIIYKDNADEGHYLKIRFMDEFCTLDFSCFYVATDYIVKVVEQGRITIRNIAKSVSK